MTPSITGFRHVGDTPMAQGRVCALVRGAFEAPDGSSFERDVVRHAGAVAVAAVIEGYLVLVRQYRAPLDRAVLEIPAGLRDEPGEDPAATARRELIEEAGVHAGSLEHLVTIAPAPGLTDELVELYHATDLREVDASAQGVEEQWMSVERHPLADVLAMIRTGDIIDAKTIIAAHLVAERLDDRRHG